MIDPKMLKNIAKASLVVGIIVYAVALLVEWFD
jgi:hypothetical protein